MYCKEKYTDLATVYDMTDMERLLNSTETRDEAWTGLYNKPGENRMWHWSLPGLEYNDNETKWADGEPNDSDGCAIMNYNELWIDVHCNHILRFICYDDKVILIKERKTWEEAVDYCSDRHHGLVSITNPVQQSWVQKRAKNADTPYVWLGLRYSCVLDLWFWVSDQLVCYDNWDPEQKTERCDGAAAMEKGGDKWVTQAETEKLNFICALH
ncbi:hypothetical protein GBF38_005062 [Nibea albiflora]|uniref:Uncharacterized protein n=1 Tax=Nibea albiflora TaxID=240163 RepID=A0ACB7EVL2_NIBAL|nr:hypothetical protein GBF38_005062 [Nibea albiflora]